MMAVLSYHLETGIKNRMGQIKIQVYVWLT